MRIKVSIPSYPDIELGCNRTTTSFSMEFPTDGINEETGIIFLISGFSSGLSQFEEDMAPTAKDSLASEYNCLLINVEYFGIHVESEKPLDVYHGETFLAKIEELYNIPRSEYLISEDFGRINFVKLASMLLAKGITQLPLECLTYLRDPNGEYQTFGLMSAIDHINVLGYVLERYPFINKKKIVISGLSYGAYIGALLTKFMPNTFSLFINNSSFIKAEVRFMAQESVGKIFYKHVHGLTFPLTILSPWTLLDDNSSGYLSDSHRKIRNLLLPEHYRHKSSTVHYLFHADKDEVVPLADKVKYFETISTVADARLHIISEQEVDGIIFKHNRHYMDTNARKLFDHVYALNDSNLERPDTTTDFDSDFSVSFPCADKDCVFEYRNDYSFDVRIKKHRCEHPDIPNIKRTQNGTPYEPDRQPLLQADTSKAESPAQALNLAC